MTPKILILVLAHKGQTYNNIIENGIKKTWGSRKHPNIDIYYYYGDSIDNSIIDNEIHVNIPESFSNIGLKTIAAFKLIDLQLQYDYVFRTNVSSYINQELLFNLVKTLPKNDVLAAVVGETNGIKFPSGAGFLLSRDLVQYIIQNENKWDHTHMDDVALGLLFKDRTIIPLDRRDYTDSYNNMLSDLESTYQNHYHYRCKVDYNRNIDIETMKKLHILIYNQ